MAGLFSALSTKSKIKHLIAIDIGSNTAIRSLLFDQAEADCIALKKQYFELPRREQELDLIAPISQYLRRLIFQYVKESGRVPDRTIIGLGSHFTFNEVATERLNRKRPREIISSSELQTALNGYLEKHRTRVIGQTPYALVHLMPLRITVDGYRLDILSPSTAGEVLEIDLFATYALNDYWAALWRLKSLWGGLNLGFVSNQDAIAQALVAVMHVSNALVVKIGARISEISILGDGVILFTSQFAVAGDDFTQAIAERLDIEYTEAEKIKHQWGKASLSAKMEQAADEAINSAAEVWLAELTKLLKSQEKFSLPENVFLLGGGSRLAAISKMLNAKPWYDELTFLKSLEVKAVSAEDLASHTFRNTTPPLSGPEEVALAALALKAAAAKKIVYPATPGPVEQALKS